METLFIQDGQKKVECIRYSLKNEPAILDIFFFWKTSVLLAEQTRTKKPQLPETFSEPFCCLVCDLVHKKGAGLDAYRLDENNQVTAAIEIKATVTKSGFTDVKRVSDLTELVWLSFSGYASLEYEIYRITKADLQPYLSNSNTLRDRATVNLKGIVTAKNIPPFKSGRIGIVAAAPLNVNTSLRLSEQVATLTSPE